MSIDLGINAGTGGNNWIAYKPQADEWTYPEGEIDLKYFIMDKDSMKAGWGKLAPGIAPSWQWDAKLGIVEINPGGTIEEKDEWKRGLSIELYIKDEGVFTWSTTALGPMQGLNNIYQEVFNDQGDNPNLLPVIEYTGSEATTWKKGQSRIPQFKIVKWVERPDDWDSLDNVEPEAVAPPVVEENPQDDIPF